MSVIPREAQAAAIPAFGECEPGARYALRPGGYAVIVHERSIAVVETRVGLLLPGGGSHDDEDAATAAVREAHEECGLRIAIDATLGVADELVYSRSEQRHFRKRGTFFLARVTAQEGECEAGHVLHWRDAAELAATLRYGSHRWALHHAIAERRLRG